MKKGEHLLTNSQMFFHSRINISIDNFEVKRTIYSNNNLSIKEGIDLGNNSPVQLLIIDKKSSLFESAKRSFNLTKEINHPNLEFAKDSFSEKSQRVYVIPCKSEPLYIYLSQKKELHESDLIKIVKSVLTGLSFLHEKGLTYGSVSVINFPFFLF